MQYKSILLVYLIFQDGQDSFFDLFFSLSNPVIYAILFLFIFIILILLIQKNIFTPLKKEHEQEKAQLVEKHVKQMALFAELDPGPLIRVDFSGVIIGENSAAISLNNNDSLVGNHIQQLFDIKSLNVMHLIENDEIMTFNKKINDKYYNITVKGVSEFKAAQIYLSDFTDRKLAENKLRDYQKLLTERVEEERQKIARELHDSIGQDLSFLRLDLQQIKKCGDNNISNQIANSLSSIDNIGNGLREICNRLRPRVLEEGVEPAIAALVTSTNNINKIQGTVNFIGKKLRADSTVEINVFRAVQEAITNIVKHSNAKHFNLQFIGSDEKILILISDDGVGFYPNNEPKTNQDKPRSFGLLNMRERIESVGGRFNIESAENKGTTVIFEIPRGYNNEK